MAKISIITPVFNGEKFIEDCIRSVQSQLNVDTEHIIIDGGSKDKTVDIIKSFGDKVQYISEKDNGQSDAINKGFKMATGEIITWLGVDDYFADSNVLERVMKYFEDKDVNIVEGRCKLVYLDTGHELIVPRPQVTKHNLVKWWVENSVPAQPAIFFRRSLIEKYGYLDESLHFCMDHELWLRFLSKGEKFKMVDDLFAVYQVHPESKTGSSTPKFVREHDKVAKRFWGKPWQLEYYRNVAEYLYARYYKFKEVFRYLKN
jgi:glycosyltransferase involved in cell wall biosynthesis